MKSAAYATSVFKSHVLPKLRTGSVRGMTLLELGPGDSLLSAVLGRAFGAKRVMLVDVGAFASTDIDLYRRTAIALRDELHCDIGKPDEWRSIGDMLNDCCAEYHTSGIDALRSIPAGTVDLTWSNAVLEHVRRSSLAPTLRELRRVTADGGSGSHQVDFRDHLGGGHAHLRFPSRIWEREWFAPTSGFYTNRALFSQMTREFGAAGFVVESVDNVARFSASRRQVRLAPEFADLDSDSLAISSARFLIRPAAV